MQRFLQNPIVTKFKGITKKIAWSEKNNFRPLGASEEMRVFPAVPLSPTDPHIGR